VPVTIGSFDSVWMTIIDPDRPDRSCTILWSRSNGLFTDDEEYPDEAQENSTLPISDVDVDAITALVDGLAECSASVQIDLPRLNAGLSYDLGLSWRLDLVGSRDTRATISADLDGTHHGVDQGS